MALSEEVKARRARLMTARESAIAAGWDPNKPNEYKDETKSPNPGPRVKAEPTDTDDLIAELTNRIRSAGWVGSGTGNLSKEQVIQAALLVALDTPAALLVAAVPPAKPRGRAAKQD